MTHEFDDRHEVTRRARETLARLEAAGRRRRFEEQQHGPVDIEPMPPADWHNCKTTAEMTSRQFDQWCRDGKPPLTPANRPPVVDLKVTKAQVDAAIDRERANLQSSLEEFAVVLGEEVAAIENRMRSDFKAELDALRTETSKRHDGNEIIDLPDWRSSHVEH